MEKVSTSRSQHLATRKADFTAKLMCAPRPPRRKCTGEALGLDLTRIDGNRHSILGFPCSDRSWLSICSHGAAFVSTGSPLKTN
eukprot:8103350-Pyramimonas_sp.AAC.1